MKANKEQRLFIDLDICATGCCQKCDIECSFYYHTQGPVNNGIIFLAELATYALVCRRCEQPHCVPACPVEALEQQKEQNKLLIRYNMRCISCKSCSYACPYGTIYPEHVPYLMHHCDFCLDRRSELNEPLCIKSCPHGALKLVGPEFKLDEHTFSIGDNLIVHSTHWIWEKA